VDYDGSGHIGDLKKQDFREIWSGDVAQSLRTKLLSGKLPLWLCSHCRELRFIDKRNAKSMADAYAFPTRGIMVENTVNCNLRCTSCKRHVLKKIRTNTVLSEADMHKVSSIVKNYGIEMVSFLNLGEPFLCRQVGEQLAILRNENPGIFIVSHSNGLLIDTDEKRNAAMLLDEILFSIDGADQASYVKYQRGGDFEKAYSNMKSLIDYRNKRNSKKPRIKWKYILFNWNDKNELVASAIELAKQANVDALIFTPTLGPIWGISFRYYFTRSFERIGVRTWAGREIELS